MLEIVPSFVNTPCHYNLILVSFLFKRHNRSTKWNFLFLLKMQFCHSFDFLFEGMVHMLRNAILKGWFLEPYNRICAVFDTNGEGKLKILENRVT